MIDCIEDDQNIRDLIVYTLKNSGFEAQGFENSVPFWQALREEKPELILLDIMLEGEDGLEILGKLKKNESTSDIPVIMVTARGSEYDKVLGLDSGADDYIAKPFGMMEFISRVKAVLRRSGRQKKTQEVLKAGPVTMNVELHEVKVNGREVQLTYKEFELLRYLLEGHGEVLSRSELLSNIWGYDFDGETRTVDVHVRTLRQKLGEGGDVIETVRGVGYRTGGAS